MQTTAVLLSKLMLPGGSLVDSPTGRGCGLFRAHTAVPFRQASQKAHGWFMSPGISWGLARDVGAHHTAEGALSDFALTGLPCSTPLPPLDRYSACTCVAWSSGHYSPAAAQLNAHVVAISCPIHVRAGHRPKESIFSPKGPPRVPHDPAFSDAQIAHRDTSPPVGSSQEVCASVHQPQASQYAASTLSQLNPACGTMLHGHGQLSSWHGACKCSAG